MSYIDAHIHLEQYAEPDLERLVSHAQAAGVKHVVAVSMNLESSQATHELSCQYGEFIVPAYGFHPEQPILCSEQEALLMNWIRSQALQGEKFVIGEVGLPYYMEDAAKRDGVPFHKQPYVELLERFIVLAKELDVPIVLHAVYEDAAIACDLLQKHGVHKAHFHWFKGDAETIQRMIQQGYYISITPDVLYEMEIMELVQCYPLSLMMAETDGPWQYEGPFLGKETESSMVVDVVLQIAALLNASVEQVRQQLYTNSLRFYEI